MTISLNKGLSIDDTVFTNISAIVSGGLNSMYGPNTYGLILNHLFLDGANVSTIDFVESGADLGQSAIQGMLGMYNYQKANAADPGAWGIEMDVLKVIDASLLVGESISYCDPVVQ